MGDGSISLISKIRMTVKNPTRAIEVGGHVCVRYSETKVARMVDVNDRPSRDVVRRNEIFAKLCDKF